jgi:hypothetical protein
VNFYEKGHVESDLNNFGKTRVNIFSTAFTPEITVIQICLQEGKEVKCSYCRLPVYDAM